MNAAKAEAETEAEILAAAAERSLRAAEVQSLPAQMPGHGDGKETLLVGVSLAPQAGENIKLSCIDKNGAYGTYYTDRQRFLQGFPGRLLGETELQQIWREGECIKASAQASYVFSYYLPIDKRKKSKQKNPRS